jgi:DNA invertase Pin-like site-specific DNA recombinase
VSTFLNIFLRPVETFRAQGIEFISFSEQLDTSTPAGKMVFTVLGVAARIAARTSASGASFPVLRQSFHGS